MTAPIRRRRRTKRYPSLITVLIVIGVGVALAITVFGKLSSGSQNQTDPVQMQTQASATPTDPSTPQTSTSPTDATHSTTPDSTMPTLPPAYLSPEQSIRAYAAANGLKFEDYPENLVQLLEKNPETRRFVLEYPLLKDKTFPIDLSEYKNCTSVPLLMQWDQRWGYTEYAANLAGLSACGPTCLSMAAIYLTKDTTYTPAYMIQFSKDNGYYVNGSGSSWTLFSQGAVQLGFQVTELPLVKGKIVEKLNAGAPVVCSMGPGLFTASGHYILLVGMEDGKFRINDPNSAENSDMLWSYEQIKDQIRNIWAIEKP